MIGVQNKFSKIKMKRTHSVLSIVSISLLLLWAGCKARETASGNSANAAVTATANTSSNSNQSAAENAASNANTGRASGSPATAQTGGPPNLVGTYEWREVEDKGVVTIITRVKTTFVFRPDGGYSRASQLKSKIYHTDSGRFRIEGTDKLILAIQIADKNMQTPAVTKTFKISLSPDGDQLKMTNDKGATATYERTAKPKA